jgi:dTDP-4-dehydrorhamnose reductase
MRILVTGASGLLGRQVVEIARAGGHDVIGLSHAELDVTDAVLVAKTVAHHASEAVVHCAAYTAVDRAEAEPDRAYAVNRDGARHVAQAASDAGAILLYVSTDYVFDGSARRPYLPDDPTGPLSVYGRSKLEGEEAVRGAGGEWIVVRTSWLYGGDSGFVPAILRRAARGEALRIVDDQRGRPTWAPDAATGVVELLERGARGVWHVAGGGECTWLELAREAVTLAGYAVPIERTSSAEFGAPAQRPAYSVLDLEATERVLGRPMIPWQDALEEYVGRDWAALARRTA